MTTNKDKTRSQIFSKGPALTRDIIIRMQNNKTHIMGRNVDAKQFWVFSGLLLLFSLSFVGTIAMWFTGMFDNAVFASMALVEGTKSHELWAKPSPKPLLSVYLFNYTNVPNFQSGYDEKLNVNETGPYVYEMTLERINERFNGNRVTYQEKKLFKFMPELSRGHKQNDKVVVPNIPLLSAASINKHMNFFTRIGLSGVLNSLDAKPFLSLAAHRFITGYEDRLYSLSKSYLKFQNIKTYDRFGLLSREMGVGEEMTINTGADDINKIGFIESINGKYSIDQWSTDECNDIHSATDGTFFPPKMVRNKKPLSVYTPNTCRVWPLHFQKETKILQDRVPAYRYVMPDSAFDSADRVSANQCYCNMDSGECPLQGLFNATPCNFGAPFFLSQPHFYNADPILRERITGLDPKPEHHHSYLDLHPTLGFVMTAKSRSQINVQVAKTFGISQVNMFEDGLMLPVAWLELSLEDKKLPEDMVGIIFQTTFTLRAVEMGLKYGCFLSSVVTLIGLILVMRRRWINRERTSSRKPFRRSDGEFI